MTIAISNLTTSDNAVPGTIIGVLTAYDSSGDVIPCNFTLTKGSTGHFAISDDKLMAAWNVPITPGHYSVRVHAMARTTRFSGSAKFMVTVEVSASPLTASGVAVAM